MSEILHEPTKEDRHVNRKHRAPFENGGYFPTPTVTVMTRRLGQIQSKQRSESQ